MNETNLAQSKNPMFSLTVNVFGLIGALAFIKIQTKQLTTIDNKRNKKITVIEIYSNSNL